MNSDIYNLQRFVDAQEHSYAQALAEIKQGMKQSHWMWYIFPQWVGLGRSSISKQYSIHSKEEALTYLNHPILGHRLLEITESFLQIKGKTAAEILGRVDAAKMQSSMTLFDEIQEQTNIFAKVLEKFYDGKRCQYTISKLGNNFM